MVRIHRNRGALICLAALAVGAAALAQPEKKPAPGQPPAKPADPTPADPSVDQIIKDLQKPDQTRKPAAPAPVAQPPRPEPADAAQAITGRLLREGTFLSARRGRVTRGAGGEWMYVFDADADGQADPPMVLMPCLALMSMEKVAERHGEGVTFTVSGQVFVYHGRNYLLPVNPVVNRPATDVRSAQ